MDPYDFGPPDTEALQQVIDAHVQMDPPDSPIFLLSVIPPEDGYFSEFHESPL
jgi:hypothetical protein